MNLTRQQERLIRRLGYTPTPFPLPRYDRDGNPRPRFANNSIATANRWTGKPHEHAREIARRERQSA